MLTEFDDEELAEDRSLREQQEREIALGRMLARAGIAFDPMTFVALRIVEGSRDEHVDPLDCLNVLVAFGFLERSVALVVDLLDEAA